MRSLASCGGPFTERLSCGVLLAIFRTPEALPGRVDGECSPAGPPPLHQSGGSHDGADAKSSSSTPLKSASFCSCGQPENSHTAGILAIGDEFRERNIFR